MKIKNFDFWYRNAKRFSLLLLSSIFLFSGLMHAQNVNMSRYITLNVAKDSLISISLSTDAANTPIRIVSGDSVYDFTTTSISLTTLTTYYAGANTMTIYGNVKRFDCYSNKTKITGIDVSKNVALCTLSCYNNNISALDVSKNTALTFLSCETNLLTSLDVTQNTALTSLHCNKNQLTSLDVNGCTALTYLSCYRNQLTSLDLSNNTALTYLHCYRNQLTSLDLSNNTALTSLACYNNQLTSLNVSKNTALCSLYCDNNNLTTLDVSACTSLNFLRCYNNKFSTAGYDSLMCSLPSKSVSDNARFYPLYNANDANSAIFLATNATNATAKNWQVVYIDNNNPITTNGNYDCSGVNMNRYIKLNVAKESVITLNWTTDSANTPVKIVSGDSVYEFTTTSTNLTTATSYRAGANTMTIYGDVKDFRCNANKTKITGIDVSKNVALCTLYCYDNNISALDVSKNTALIYLSCRSNQLTSLDVSTCTNLTYLNCYGNKFSTAGYDSLMCSLPLVSSGTGSFRPLYNSSDTNATKFAASNSLNAKAKNWNVQYYSGGAEIPATTGNYDCSGANMNRYITLNVTKDSLISIDLSADNNNTPIKIVSGTWDTTIIADVAYTGNINYFAGANTMTIYGDVKGFNCSDNDSNIIGLDASHNTALTVLVCTNNNLTTLDVSGCTNLHILFCSYNNLTTLDVSACTNLEWLICYDNKLTTLDVSGCSSLEKLYCSYNNLTSLDVSTCTALISLECNNNKFSTAGYDSLMCSLPSKNVSDNARFYPLYNANDTNATKFLATNASNATAKNWSVQYYSGGTAIPATTGNYDCSGANMNRYIKLNVAKESVITLNWTTDSANTPVKIVSGDSVYEFTMTSVGWIGRKSCYAADDTMYVYGNVKYFSCSNNAKKITGVDISNNLGLTNFQCTGDSLSAIDVSKNTALTYLHCGGNQLTSLDISKNTALINLYCNGNQLTSLDVSKNTALKTLSCNNNQLTSLDLSKNVALCTLYCYRNPFTIAEYDNIMCSLPSRSASDNARFYPLYDANDANSTTFLATNASNATAKNWQVIYSSGGGTIPATSGNYDCSGANMSRYITLNVAKDSLISIDLSADKNNTPIKIVSGTWDTTINAGVASTGKINYFAGANTMTIYGDVKDFRCNANKTKITGIDVSKNVALCTLYCYDNNISALDVSKNTALTDLRCYTNQLTSLDLSKNVALCTLYCGSNQLTSLDLSKNPVLGLLSCGANPLTSLDVSNNTALTYLNCGINQLTSLDISKNTALTSLSCYTNQLTSLDVSKNTALITLYCYTNQLTSLDLSKNTALTDLRCYTNQLTSLDISQNTALTYLACYGNPFTTAGYDSIMCSLPIVSSGTGSFRPLYNSSDTNATKFAASNSLNAKAKNWNVQYYSGGTAIPATTGNYDCRGVNMNRYITLNVTKDSLISIRLATDAANTPVRIVSGDSVYDFTTTSTSLTTTTTYYAGANTMTIYGDVKDFRCYANKTKITGIDVSNNTALKDLYCYDNQLTSLDISKNTALTNLQCNANQLTSLDLSNNTALTYLNCGINQLTSLDVSKNLALRTLSCYGNQLTNLDVSKNVALCTLYCYDNNISALDLSKNTALCSLYCDNNNLTTLDVSACTSLNFLRCYSNKFSTTCYDSLMCSLTSRSVSDNARFYPLYNANDTNATKFLATNASNATAKNWSVQYYSNDLEIPATSGNYDCRGVNMNRYIILTVPQWQRIEPLLYAEANNTPIKIVSGSWDTVIFRDASTTPITPSMILSFDFYFNAHSDTVIIYGNVKEFICPQNNIYTLDVSNNTELIYLGCWSNNLTSLNVSACTSLEYLVCSGNNLTFLNVSNCTALTELYCNNNNLTTLDVSVCSALTSLSCNSNNLTTLDIRATSSLSYLQCYDNPFSTAGYDSLMCSLPSKSVSDNAKFYPLYDANDINATKFMASNSQNAKNKNWSVLYRENYSDIPATSGNYDCNGVNMGRYIILNVAKDSLININLSAEVDNTSIRIMSGDSIYNITASTNWIGKTNYFAHAETMVIYGNIKSFDCNENNTKITGLNVSNNPTLTSLYCNDNALTSLIVDGCSILDTLTCNNNNLNSLDISTCSSLQILYCSNNNLSTLDVSTCNAIHAINCSNNELTSLNVVGCTVLKKLTCTENALTILDLSSCIALNTLSCYGNNFTIKGYDSLMCSLPSKSSNDNAKFYPLYDANDINATKFMASNAQNVMDKNWQVNYLGDVKIPSTSGTYDCDGVNMGRYIILNVAKDSLIRLNFIADNANTFVRIVSSSWDTIIKVDTRWIGYIYYFAYTDTITIYGNVQQFDCRENNSNIIKLDASHNTELIALYCYANTLTSLNVSNNPSLKWLSCYENALTSLDISSCSSLENLDCGKNNLTSLNVSNCKSLVSLYCYSNAIRSLDIRNNTEVEWLSCYENALTSLDISNNKKLIFLAMMFNPFSTGAYDTLMCLLPTIHSNSSAMFFPLMDKSDSAGSIFATTNSNNAKAKGWQVIYYADYYTQADTISSTIGTFNCDGTIPEEDTTSITEVKLSNIELYPNPANSMLTIKNATANVQIFDITGREIMHVENKGEALLQINVSNLSKGMYFVKVGNYTTKFVKE